jgi:hypothetical protein
MLFETLNISKSEIEREYFRHCGIKRSHYLLKKRYDGIIIYFISIINTIKLNLI